MEETKMIPELLDEELEAELKELSMLSGEERNKAVDDLTKLYKLRIEELRANLEFETEQKKIEAEKDRVMREALSESRKRKEERLSTYLRCGLTTAEILLTLGFNWVWMNKGLKFEETGSITSTTFGNLIRRFMPNFGSKI